MLKAVHIIMGGGNPGSWLYGYSKCHISMGGLHIPGLGNHVSGWLPHGERTKSCCSIVFFNKNIFFLHHLSTITH